MSPPQISALASFQLASGTASFSLTSTAAWWIESPTTWTFNPFVAANKRSSLVFFFFDTESVGVEKRLVVLICIESTTPTFPIFGRVEGTINDDT